MKIAVIGSRAYPELSQVRAYVAALPDGTVLVTGGARGVDAIAEEAARARGLAVEVIRPDYAAFPGNPRAAPIARNQEIVRQSDAVVVFWDGTSRGSASVIRFAQRQNKPTTVYTPDGQQPDGQEPDAHRPTE